MERFFKITLALMLAASVIACQAAEADADDASSYMSCPKVSGNAATGFTCYVDSYALISRPADYCNLRIVTFGFISETWGQLSLYPDQSRASAQHMFSAVALNDVKSQDALAMAIKNRSGSFPGEVIGKFRCYDQRRSEAIFGVGEIIDIERVGVFEKGSNADPAEINIYSKD